MSQSFAARRRFHRLPVRRRPSPLCATALTLVGLALAPAVSAAQPARPGAPVTGAHKASANAGVPGLYAQLADDGLTAAQRWHNGRLHWWNKLLNDHAQYPLATIWDAIPLWEALAARAQAPGHGASATRSLKAFAAGAEKYWDPAMKAYGPYKGDRNREKVWFDDNGWWGLGFADTYLATHSKRYLKDAEKAFRFVASQGWAADGGLWWNTGHPYKSGEALAANTLLGALIFQATHDPYYLNQVTKFITWADRASIDPESGLYVKSQTESIPMPYVEGPMIAAHQVLCEATGQQSYCQAASGLMNKTLRRFQVLGMGPKYDTIYLHWVLYMWTRTHDVRLWQLAYRYAERARQNLRASSHLYTRDWSGGSVAGQSDTLPNMLQTHAATVELFAWMSALPAP